MKRLAYYPLQFFLIFAIWNFSNAEVKYLESFLMRFHLHGINVEGPPPLKGKQNKLKTSLIIENKTIEPLWMKLIYTSSAKKPDSFFSVLPNESKSLPITLQKGEMALVVPLSPPAQELPLIIGKGPYSFENHKTENQAILGNPNE